MSEALLTGTFIRLETDLRAIGVRWALVGGLAVSVRSEPRTTRDIDVAIAVTGDSEAEQVVQALRNRGYLEEEVMDHRDIDRLSTVRFRHRDDGSGVVCDVLFATAGIEPEAVAAAEILEVLRGLYAPVARTGHLLAFKILALRPDRPQERPQDFADIRELLQVADDAELRRARAALELISRRGFDRGKDLGPIFEEQLAQFREGQRSDRR
jgi:predicted nucleotidyltransferase